MGKSNDRNVLVDQEFASLEKVLDQSADDAARCLKLLKKNLSEYDSRHSNHFMNTAASYMRNDMRTAKDTAEELKHVAHQIRNCTQPSEYEIASARNMMGTTAKAMEILKTTARNYDQKNGRSKGVKGAVDNVVGNNDREKDERHTGLLGENDNEKHTGLFGKKKDKESKGGLFGKNNNKEKESKLGGLFGKSDKKVKDDKHNGLLGGKTDHHHGGRHLGSADTVEEVTKMTLHDNFSLSPLSHQITIAEKSLSPSPSFVDRAKEVVHEVKEKIKGDKTSPTHDGHHARKRAATP